MAIRLISPQAGEVSVRFQFEKAEVEATLDEGHRRYSVKKREERIVVAHSDFARTYRIN